LLLNCLVLTFHFFIMYNNDGEIISNINVILIIGKIVRVIKATNILIIIMLSWWLDQSNCLTSYYSYDTVLIIIFIIFTCLVSWTSTLLASLLFKWKVEDGPELCNLVIEVHKIIQISEYKSVLKQLITGYEFSSI